MQLKCEVMQHTRGISPHVTLQVARSQEAVNHKLHMLEAHQKETHDSLMRMESTAMSMYQVGTITQMLLIHHCIAGMTCHDV